MIRYLLVLVLALGGCSWIESDAGEARLGYLESQLSRKYEDQPLLCFLQHLKEQ